MAGLGDLPTNVFTKICSFLGFNETKALSQTCKRVNLLLNDDSIWYRYSPRYLRNLSEPQVEGPELNEEYCDDKQLIAKRNRINSNWIHKRFAKKEASFLGACSPSAVFLFSHTLLLVLLSGVAEFWDVTGEPRLCGRAEINVGEYQFQFLIDSWLVLVSIPTVQVTTYTKRQADKDVGPYAESFLKTHTQTYEPIKTPFNMVFSVDAVGHSLRLVFSFFVDGSEAYYHTMPVRQPRVLDYLWRVYSAGQYLLCFKPQAYPDGDRRNCPAVFHLWDITKAFKVGDFVAPFDSYSSELVGLVGDFFTLKTTLPLGQETFHRFNVKTAQFAEIGLTFPTRMSRNFPTQDKLIRFTLSDDLGNTNCEVYNLESCDEVGMTTLPYADLSCQKPEIENDKFVVSCFVSFHLVDSRSLDTLAIVHHESEVSRILLQPTVFGSRSLVVLEKTGDVSMWNFFTNSPTLLCKGSCRSKVCLEKGMFTKFVLVDGSNLCVLHFW